MMKKILFLASLFTVSAFSSFAHFNRSEYLSAVNANCQEIALDINGSEKVNINLLMKLNLGVEGSTPQEVRAISSGRNIKNLRAEIKNEYLLGISEGTECGFTGCLSTSTTTYTYQVKLSAAEILGIEGTGGCVVRPANYTTVYFTCSYKVYTKF